MIVKSSAIDCRRAKKKNSAAVRCLTGVSTPALDCQFFSVSAAPTLTPRSSKPNRQWCGGSVSSDSNEEATELSSGRRM